MGDMGEVFNAMKKHNKKIRQNNLTKYEPILQEIGAAKKADGVYEYNDWFLYPSKNFVMYKFNNKQRMSLDKFLKRANK